MLGEPSNTTSLNNTYQVKFQGLKHYKAAEDGDIYWMENMSSRDYPILSPREPRRKQNITANAKLGFICIDDKVAYVSEETVSGTTKNIFYYDGYSCELDVLGERKFALVNSQLMLIPDYKVFHIIKKTMIPIESTVTCNATMKRYGELYGATAECNSLYCESVNWSDYFTAGDAVTISNAKNSDNDKSVIIRNIDGHWLYTYEYAFTLDMEKYTYSVTTGLPADDYSIKTEDGYCNFTITERLKSGTQIVFDGTLKISDEDHEFTKSSVATGEVLNATEIVKDTLNNNITLKRECFKFDYIFSSANRVWGCKDDTIYASKLGDPFNWSVFDGLSTDSYSLDTGTPGKFTAAVDFSGYPTFFKENRVFKVYGTYPSQYEVVNSRYIGVREGCSETLAVAGETLFYVSKQGVMGYQGSVPYLVSEDIDIHPIQGVGGTDGRKYYLSCLEDHKWNVYVWDTYDSLWHREDDFKAVKMDFGDYLYATDENGDLWCINGSNKGTVEDEFEWFIETADTSMSMFNRKGASTITVRSDTSRLIGNEYVEVWSKVDNEPWEYRGRLTNAEKHIDRFPNVPKRGDHIRLKLIGKGDADIYGFTVSYYEGSDF